MKSCVLYKPGAKFTVKGVDCDIIKVSPNQIKDYTAKGWFIDTNFKKPRAKKVKKEVE